MMLVPFCVLIYIRKYRIFPGEEKNRNVCSCKEETLYGFFCVWIKKNFPKGIFHVQPHILVKRGEAMKGKDDFVRIFATGIREILQKIDVDFEKLQEIRLRVDKPLLITCAGREYFVSVKGRLSTREADGYMVQKKELLETMEYIANYSLYAFEDELKQGFITIQGGHRVGIAGKIIMDSERIKSVKYISFINVRLSHQIKGCATDVLPYVIQGDEICHTLIISPPRCGKTTLLRDMIRQLSNGTSYFQGSTIGVVDERSEIGGAYLGVPQNDLGIRTDVLDCCPKAEGMMMLVRSMSPRIIAVDEIGDYEDIHAIESVIHCGCKLLATVHGSSIEDVKRKPLLQKLVLERVFERYIILHNYKQIGKVKEIFDERGTRLYDKEVFSC